MFLKLLKRQEQKHLQPTYRGLPRTFQSSSVKAWTVFANKGSSQSSEGLRGNNGRSPIQGFRGINDWYIYLDLVDFLWLKW